MKNIHLQLLTYFLIFFLSNSKINFAQIFNWASRAGGTGSDIGQSISTDGNGNSYVTGIFGGTATFGTIQLGSYGGTDIFIAKYDEIGNCIWAVHGGGIEYEFASSISTDGNGNSYVTGDFLGTATFGSIQLVAYGDRDIFIAKYDDIGNCIWAVHGGGIGFDLASSISTDDSGNSYVTGQFSGTATFGTIQLVSYGDIDIFIAKYDDNGNCIWAKNAGGIEIDQGQSISIDGNGNSYVIGKFWGTATFGTIQLVSYGASDIFIAKYDSIGNCLWAKMAGGTMGDDEGCGISTDANGNCYITGRFYVTATFGTIQLVSYGASDIFITKYDASGNCIWAKNAGGSSSGDVGYGISTDANGNCYITGHFSVTATFGTIQLVSYGGGDIFITKYDDGGNCIWAKNAGGNLEDSGYSISTDDNGNYYVTGNFWGTATFGSIQLVSDGYFDFFIFKYGVVSSIEGNPNMDILPDKMGLNQNYPNPFNPSTSIQYAISSTQFVTLKVYDLLGREVATLVNEEKPAGSYNAQFTMNNVQLSSGIYFYKLQAGDFVETKKMIFLK